MIAVLLEPRQISPDQVTMFPGVPGLGWLNATIFYTWIVMAILVLAAWLGTRNLSTGRRIGRFQNALEMIVGFVRNEIRELSGLDPDPFLPFIGTLFLFILFSNLVGTMVPWFAAPTSSLSTTAALAVCVFVAVPIFGVAHSGFRRYLKNYVRPTPLMLPFNIIGELSRTLALAVRLFGNMMSGAKVAGILVSLVPALLPVVMDALGLLIGTIQAYIFTALAMVYISSGMRARKEQAEKAAQRAEGAS